MSKFTKLVQRRAKTVGCGIILFSMVLVIIGVILMIINVVNKAEALELSNYSSAPTVTTTTTATKKEIEKINVVVHPLYDIPLSDNLQRYITEECDGTGIDPTIIFAMIERETNYDAQAIGDDGESYGIMQIKAKYHYQRMVELKCTNLLDPYQNVTVGIDILCEKLNKYGNMQMALVSYNAGSGGAYEHYFSKGVYSSDYSRAVMERANELKGGAPYAVQ